ncbi:MAG: hypothetical protein JWM91_574 [Rhodospirillales bacterium]|nr:hypothetical protein [Rhodospirillales bacterium]
MANNVVTQNIIASSPSSPTAFHSINGGTPAVSNSFNMDLINRNFRANDITQSNAQYDNTELANEAGGN